MTGEESVEQDYERDRLVGWTTSEEVRGSTEKSHDQEYMHKLMVISIGKKVIFKDKYL